MVPTGPLCLSLNHHLSELRRLASRMNSKFPLIKMKRSDPLRDLERDRESPISNKRSCDSMMITMIPCLQSLRWTHDEMFVAFRLPRYSMLEIDSF